MTRDYPALYKELRWRPKGILVHLPGVFGRRSTLLAYAVSNKILGFN